MPLCNKQGRKQFHVVVVTCVHNLDKNRKTRETKTVFLVGLL